MPALRPHQKTHVHLRDSATVDFGPAGASLTNNGVTVADDVFTFASGNTIATDWNPAADNERVTISCWYRRTNSDTTLIIFSNSGNLSSRFVFAIQDGSAAGAISACTVNAFFIDGVLQAGTVTRQDMFDVVQDNEWHHFVADVTMATGWTTGTNQIGAYSWSAIYNLIGDVADFRINAGGLTSGEVFDLFNGGRGFDLPIRRQLKGTCFHLLDGMTDASFHSMETNVTGDVTYDGKFVFDSSLSPAALNLDETFVVSEATGLAMSFWIKPDDFDGRQFLFCHGTTTYIEISGSTSLRYKASDNTLRFRNISLTAGQLHHIVVSVEGTTATVYVDAVSAGTFAVSGSSTFSISQFSINHATFTFSGELHDARIFDRSVSSGEVANLNNKGSQGFEPFGNLGGEVLNLQPSRYSGSGDVLDESGNGRALPAVNMGTTVITNSALVFDGVSDHALMGDSDPLVPATGNFTLFADVTPLNIATDKVILAQYSVAFDNGRMIFRIDDSRWNLFLGDNGSSPTVQFFGPNVVSGTRYRVAVTRNGNTFKWFIDGVEVATHTDTVSRSIEQTGNVIGGRASAANSWDTNITEVWEGQIHELRVYRRALSVSEIAFLSTGGNELPNTFDALAYNAPHYDDPDHDGTANLDWSGNQNNLEAANGATISSGAFDFTPSTTAVYRYGVNTLGPQMHGASGISFFTWINLQSASPGDYVSVIWQSEPAWGTFTLFFNGNGEISLGARSQSQAFEGFQLVEAIGHTFPLNQWVPLAGTVNFSANESKIWLSGEELTLTGTPVFGRDTYDHEDFTGVLHDAIGARENPALSMDGLLDDALWFNRTSTPAEIAFLSARRNPFVAQALPVSFFRRRRPLQILHGAL